LKPNPGFQFARGRRRGAPRGRGATARGGGRGRAATVAPRPAAGDSIATSSALPGRSGVWRWRGALTTVFRQLQGLAKLHRPLPSTAFCGNWAILAAPQLLDPALSARVFMGRASGPKGARSHIEVVVSPSDSVKVQRQQWALLKEAFCRKRTCEWQRALRLDRSRAVLCDLCCTVLYCTLLCCTVLCCAVLCCAVLCCAVLCCAVLCCAVLCCAVLCCAVLCCAVPCRAAFRQPSYSIFRTTTRSSLRCATTRQRTASVSRSC
jgi:hypothetical protein